MENAVKALLIAGSILIGIITITIFYSVYRSTSEIVGVNTEDTSQTALKDFNLSYEAYNKKLMYGIDIITVLNKAIDNNRQYDMLYGENSTNQRYKDYYVDIEFTVYKRNENGRKVQANGEVAEKENQAVKVTYSLSKNYIKKPDNIIENDERDDIYDIYLSKVGKADDDVFRSFKFSGFKCTKVEYVKKTDVELTDLGAVRKS